MFSALVNALEAILETIAPLKPRAARIRKQQVEDLQLAPKEHKLLGKRVTTLFDYKRNDVRDLIRALKYDGNLRAASLAASGLSDFLREEIATTQAFSARAVFLVPVPLHKSRAQERGFNQIELVLRALPKEFRDGTLARIEPQLLKRGRKTSPQTHLSRKKRLENVRDAFFCTDTARVSTAHIYLIDDVTTTGATLAHASTPFKKSGAKITLLALARA